MYTVQYYRVAGRFETSIKGYENIAQFMNTVLDRVIFIDFTIILSYLFFSQSA